MPGARGGSVAALAVLTPSGGDDTPQIQAAIDGAASLGGGLVILKAGSFIVSGLVMKSGVHLMGSGYHGLRTNSDSGNPGGASANIRDGLGGLFPTTLGTVLRLADYTTASVIETRGFASLTAVNQSAAPWSGEWNFAISKLAVDGNRGNGGMGWGLRLYAANYLLEDVQVFRCGLGGIWSEFDDQSAVIMQELSTTWRNVKSTDNDGIGVVFIGPHDSQWMGGYANRNKGANIVHGLRCKGIGVAGFDCSTTVIKSVVPVFVAGHVGEPVKVGAQTSTITSVQSAFQATVTTPFGTAPLGGDCIIITPGIDSAENWQIHNVHTFSSFDNGGRALVDIIGLSDSLTLVDCAVEGATVSCVDISGGSARIIGGHYFCPTQNDRLGVTITGGTTTTIVAAPDSFYQGDVGSTITASSHAGEPKIIAAVNSTGTTATLASALTGTPSGTFSVTLKATYSFFRIGQMGSVSGYTILGPKATNHRGAVVQYVNTGGGGLIEVNAYTGIAGAKAILGTPSGNDRTWIAGQGTAGAGSGYINQPAANVASLGATSGRGFASVVSTGTADPTGTPNTAFTDGTTPLYFNKNTHKLFAYYSGAWHLIATGT